MLQNTPLRVLAWSINLGLLLTLATSLLFAATLLVTIAYDDEPLLSSWPIVIAPSPETYAIKVASPQLQEAQLQIDQGQLQFASDRFDYLVLKTIDAFAVLLLIGAVLWLLRALVASVRTATPFSTDNYQRLRYLALLVMAITPYQLLQGWLYQRFILQHLQLPNAQLLAAPWSAQEGSLPTVLLQLPVDLMPLWFGLLLLAIAEVFRLGSQLKTENEAFV